MEISDAEDYVDSIKEVYHVYKQGGFTITKIQYDNEFCKAMDDFAARQNPPIK